MTKENKAKKEDDQQDPKKPSTYKKCKDTLAKTPLVGKMFQPKPRIAVIRMAGVIADAANTRKSGISHQKFLKVIDKTFADEELTALALVINSPGGAPAQCSLITSQIIQHADKKQIPVFAFVEDVAASGGYWLACAADRIYAQESSIIGSIGVVSGGFGFVDLIKKYGIERRVYTAGKNKSFLDPFLEENPADVKRLKKIQNDIHESFKDWVHERRGNRLNGTDAQLMDGSFWAAEEALEKGLIDGIGNLEQVLKEEYGDKVKFIPMEPEKSFLAGLNPLNSGDAKIFSDILIDAFDEVQNRTLWARFGL